MKFRNKETNETVEAKTFTELFAYTNNSNWEKIKPQEVKDISKMNKTELLKIAEEKGIEITESATKEVIINLIKEQEENKE